MKILNDTLQLHFLLFWAILALVAALFFVFGRYVFFLKNGAGIVTKSVVQPVKVVRSQSLKGRDVYAAAANRLKVLGEVIVQTNNEDKTLYELARRLKLTKGDIWAVRVEGNSWKFTLKNFNQPKNV